MHNGPAHSARVCCHDKFSLPARQLDAMLKDAGPDEGACLACWQYYRHQGCVVIRGPDVMTI